MHSQNDAKVVGGTVMVIAGLTATQFPVKIQSPAGCVNGLLRYISGGSVSILPNALASGATVGGATVGTGYLLGANEFKFDGPANFWVACTKGDSAAIGLAFYMGDMGATLA